MEMENNGKLKLKHCEGFMRGIEVEWWKIKDISPAGRALNSE
jgi:hypothetical protein